VIKDHPSDRTKERALREIALELNSWNWITCIKSHKLRAGVIKKKRKKKKKGAERTAVSIKKDEIY